MKTTSRDLFEILAREHSPSLLVYLKSVVRDHALVDDLYQETMLTAWRSLDHFDRERPFGPWLRGIAAKLVMAHFRKNTRAFVSCDQVILEQIDFRLSQVDRRPGDTFDQRLDDLRECLGRLPAPYRAVIDARYRDDVRGESLAVHLSLSVENVKKRLQRARQRLLECLEGKLATGDA